MARVDKKVLENLILYKQLIYDRNMFIIYGLIAILLLAFLLKYFNVLEGFGDLTRNNIGPVNDNTRIKRSTWNGIKDDVLRNRSDPDLQKYLQQNWKKVMTEQEALHYNQFGKFPYPESIVDCVTMGKEGKKLRKAKEQIELYQKTLPIRVFIKKAQYSNNKCIKKVPELKFIRDLSNSAKGVETADNRKLYCNVNGDSKYLRAYNIKNNRGREKRNDPHLVKTKNLPNLVPEFTFLNKHCNPCDDMVNCKFGLNNEISKEASTWWGLDSSSSSQILN